MQPYRSESFDKASSKIVCLDETYWRRSLLGLTLGGTQAMQVSRPPFRRLSLELPPNDIPSEVGEGERWYTACVAWWPSLEHCLTSLPRMFASGDNSDTSSQAIPGREWPSTEPFWICAGPGAGFRRRAGLTKSTSRKTYRQVTYSTRSGHYGAHSKCCFITRIHLRLCVMRGRGGTSSPLWPLNVTYYIISKRVMSCSGAL